MKLLFSQVELKKKNLKTSEARFSAELSVALKCRPRNLKRSTYFNVENRLVESKLRYRGYRVKRLKSTT